MKYYGYSAWVRDGNESYIEYDVNYDDLESEWYLDDYH